MEKRFNFKVILAAVLVLIIGFSLTNCGKRTPSTNPDELGTDKQIYDKAKKRIKRDPEKARLLFKEIMHLYPDSIYARRAKIGIADSYFRQKDSASLIMAAAEYQEFVNMYPNSPDAVYAKYQTAMCYFGQMKKPGRDQTNTHLAIRALESMIRQYPDTKEAEEAKKKITKARSFLAKHYFRIGLSNFQLKAFKGALFRFKQVIDDYPEFEIKDKLFFYTGRCYFAMKDYASSISFFQKIINSFPQSKYVKKAKGMIQKISSIKATKGAESKKQPKKE